MRKKKIEQYAREATAKQHLNRPMGYVGDIKDDFCNIARKLDRRADKSRPRPIHVGKMKKNIITALNIGPALQ